VILHLLRHGKSSWDEPALDDSERPLAPRGERSARRLAPHLAEAGVKPSLVLCSTARRARQTLELICDGLPDGVEILYEPGLYSGGPDRILARLRRLARRHEEVLVIGHNPALQELALLLAGRAAPRQLRSKFPTGALVSLRLRGSTWRTVWPGQAEVVEVWRPRSDFRASRGGPDTGG